jgi:8-oxo-dGTP pyrophosphatase MutT (NUDIX family)
MNSAIIQRLREGLAGPLPGHDAFMELSGYKRMDIDLARAQDPPPRESAVLVLLYPGPDELNGLLMVRPEYDGVHSGQVSFPGGKWEPGDPSLLHTALREFAEETGADPQVDILGSLSPVYIPPSRMLVTPYVGHTTVVPTWDPDPMEVARLLEVPLRSLMQENILKRREQFINVIGRQVEIPYFDVQGEVVWGATALMIAELRQLLGALDDTKTA